MMTRPTNFFGLYWAAVCSLLTFTHIFQLNTKSSVYFSRHLMVAMLISLAVFPKKMSIWSLPIFVFLAHSYLKISAPAGTEQWLFVALGAAVAIQIGSLWDKQSHRYFVIGLYFMAGLSALWVLANYLNYDPYYWIVGRPRAFTTKEICGQVLCLMGPADNHIYSSSLLALAAPFLHPLMSLPILGLAIAMKSMTGVLGASVAVVYGSIRLWGVRVTLQIGAALSAVAAVVAALHLDRVRAQWAIWMDPSERLNAWVNIWKSEKLDLVWGHGLGFFYNYGQEVTQTYERFRHPHNEYISIAIAFGIPVATTLLALLLYRMWVSNSKNITPYNVSLLVFLVMSLTSFPLHTAPTAAIFIVNLGNIFRTKELI